MHNCQPLHHLLYTCITANLSITSFNTSVRNSVIFTLLAITHYFAKYHHLDKIVVFTAISCTCITANLSITSFNALVSSTLSSLPFLQPLITSQNILILTKIVVFTAISCTCITANLFIISFNTSVFETLSSLLF